MSDNQNEKLEVSTEKTPHPGEKQVLRVVATFIVLFICMFVYALVHNKQI